MSQPPKRFTIVPDDYHVPYAGTAEDGRKFFLSDELFGFESGYVGLFLWKADGTYDEVRVDEVRRTRGVPPGMAASAGADDLVAARLAELGKYVLEPIEVEPFTEEINGVTSAGWAASSRASTRSTSSQATSSPTTNPGTASSTTRNTPDRRRAERAYAAEHFTKEPCAQPSGRPFSRYAVVDAARAVRAAAVRACWPGSRRCWDSGRVAKV